MAAVNASAKKKRRKYLLRRKRTLDPGLVIDYKSPDVLKRFITDRGKIIPRRISGATQEQQRKIALAVKRARYLALLPCSVAHETERGFAGEMQSVAQTFLASVRVRGPQRPRPNQGEGEGRQDAAKPAETAKEGE